MDRTARGRHEFGLATDGRGPVATGVVRQASRVLAEGVEEFIFGDVFSQSTLSARERELLTVAVLAAIGGADNQLGVHVPAALRCGADPEEMIALCEQIAPYAGFPRALNALRAVRGVLEDRGLPLPVPAARVRLGDHETLVVDTGAPEGAEGADPVVLVHSLVTDRRLWRDVIALLAPRRRVIAYDLRGHGHAALAPPAPGCAALAGDLAALMDALGVARAHVAGVSLGGCVAQELALAHPGRVSGLTLVSTFARAPREVCERRAADGEQGGNAAMVPSLARWMSPLALAEDGWGARYLRDRLRRMPAGDWAAGWRALGGFDAAGRLGALAVPVAVVVGSADPVTPPAEAEALARAIPGAALHVIEGGSHMLPLERTEELAALIT